MIEFFSYVSIFIIMVVIFILTLKVSQKIGDKAALGNAIKNNNSYVIFNSKVYLDEENISQNARDTLKKIQNIQIDKKNKDNFIDKIKYQVSYVYDYNPIKSYMIMNFKSISFCFGLLYFMSDFSMILCIIISIFGGVVLSFFVLKHLYDKKITNFLDNFVYALELIARGVRSGLAINDCFLQVARDSEPVVAEQFFAMTEDFKLGLSADQVMDRFMKRLDLKEVHFFCLAIMIQRKTGGNLAEVLSSLSKILRNRKSLILKIKTLSSEAKTSAMIMGGMPICIVLLLSFVAPDYMRLLTHTDSGHMVLFGCAIWMGIGSLIMRSMINFYR